jgi:WD40 repeat protein
MKNGNIAVGLQSGAIHILEKNSFTKINELHGSQKEVFALTDSNLTYLVSGSDDGEIKEWYSNSSFESYEKIGYKITNFLVINDSILVSWSDVSNITLWNLFDKSNIATIFLNMCNYSNRIQLYKQELLVVACENYSIMLIDINGNCDYLTGPTDVINDLVILANNSLASASNDGVIHIWDLETRLFSHTIVINETIKKLEYLSWTQLACGLVNGDIEIWDYVKNKRINVLKGHSKPITVLKRSILENLFKN